MSKILVHVNYTIWNSEKRKTSLQGTKHVNLLQFIPCSEGFSVPVIAHYHDINFIIDSDYMTQTETSIYSLS